MSQEPTDPVGENKPLYLFIIGQPLSEQIRIVTALTRSTLDYPKMGVGLSGNFLAMLKPIELTGAPSGGKMVDDILRELIPFLSSGEIDPKWPFEELPVSMKPDAKTLRGLDFIFSYTDESGVTSRSREVRVFFVDHPDTMKQMAREDDPNGTEAFFPKGDDIERSILFLATTLHESSVSPGARNEELLVRIASAIFGPGKSYVSSGQLVLSPMELALLDRSIAVQRRAEALDRWAANENWPPGVIDISRDDLAQTLHQDVEMGPGRKTAKAYAVLTSQILQDRAPLFKLLSILEDWRSSSFNSCNSTGSAMMVAPYGLLEDGQLNLYSGSKPGHCIPFLDERGSAFENTGRADTPALMPQGGQAPHVALLLVHDPFFMAAFDLMNEWATDYELVRQVMDVRTAMST